MRLGYCETIYDRDLYESAYEDPGAYQQCDDPPEPTQPPVVPIFNPIPFEPTNWDPVPPSVYLPALPQGSSPIPGSGNQPPVVATGTPAIADAQPPAVLPDSWTDWFSKSTTLFGYSVPNWGLVAAGAGAMLMMGGGASKRGRKR